MWIVVISILFLVVLAFLHVMEKRNVLDVVEVIKEKKEKVEVHWKDSILVVFPVYRHEKAAECLVRLFDSAIKPKRVFVAILEHSVHTAGSVSTIEEYSRLIHGDASKKSYISHIRSHHGNITEVFGGSVARQEIISKFYNDECYLLFVHSHSWFLQGWDNILTDSLKQVDKGLGNHVLSSYPFECEDIGNLLYLKTLPATFPVFDKFIDGTPSFKGRLFVNGLVPPTRQGIASYKCLFGTAEVLFKQLAVHDPGVPFIKSYESDFILSTELWTQGFHVYCPSQSPIVHLQTDFHSYRDIKSKSLLKFKELVLHFFKTGEEKEHESITIIEKFKARGMSSPLEFHKWLGFNVKEQQIAGRLLLGLLANYTDSELINKYGSVFKFQQLKNQFCK